MGLLRCSKKDVENFICHCRENHEAICCISISHKLDEMMDITDRITILNNGKCKVATVQTSDINEELLAEMVVGNIKNKYPKVRYEKKQTLRFEIKILH